MSLPRWLDPLLDAEQMRETDAWAIETRKISTVLFIPIEAVVL